jgi:hypothetical protein
MKLTRKMKLKMRNVLRKSTSLFMAFALLVEITYPTQMFALTGGPSQPEVQSFEPIGTSDMVDVFSGDFNYNIPLMDVEGYPINIAYHSGIGMDQEASWVGLGWNINPGVVNRNMRGLPDDFSGDNVEKEISMKPNKTWGVATNVNFEIYGYEPKSPGSGSIGFSFGFNYNNYTGPSINQGINVNFSASMGAAGGLNAGLGLNTSSDDGLSIQPTVGFTAKVSKTERSTTTVGATFGTSFNSRGGLKQLSINTQASTSLIGDSYNAVKKDANGAIVSSTEKNTGVSLGNQGVGGTFDFGMPTYTPMITNSMKNYALSGSFTLGGEVFGVHGKFGVSGFFSSQKLASNNVSNPAFGYLYSENGQENDNALMDFNREKDGSFNKNMASLPLTNYTFDTYSVMGQGIGGSYRPFRSDIGYVFDPAGYTTNDDASLSVELGFGNLWHVGTNISVTDVNGSSGKWKNNNNALGKLKYSSKQKGSDFENVYFKEANEKTVESDTTFYADAGYDAPISPAIDFSNKYEPKLNGFGPVKRKKRDKRTQNIYFLTKKEYQDFAIKPQTNSYSYTTAPEHHIAEITTLGTDGSRYIYGIAAYNTLQKEITFSVGGTNPLTVSPRLLSNSNDESTKGLIGYSTSDRSTGNSLGIDSYYSSTKTPAYAHSYLLTSVLSPDYIDADAIRGPSDGDFGNYTRFAYHKIDGYKWRTPFEANKASYTEGMKSDLQDDKANIIYGEKELWYLDSVITKNYVAVFHTSNRNDGVGVTGIDGGVGSVRMLKLDSISLYSKADLKANPSTAQPIKRVHFEYDYSLCKNIPNYYTGASPSYGKLTLKKIYFTYQNSHKARLSPYVFIYDSLNPDYNLKGYDRWGNYKPNHPQSIGVRAYSSGDIGTFVTDTVMPASDYPYVEQNKTQADSYASAWSLTEIQLPSGGKIKVSYESDDYAYVQNRQAMQMFKVTNVNSASDAGNTNVSFTEGGDKFYFKLQDGITDIDKYIGGITNLYFRFLIKIRNVGGYDHYEYVSGYGEIDRANCGISGSYGYVKFKDVLLEPKRSYSAGINPYINPIVRSAVQYARLYMPKKAYTANASSSLAEAAGIESSSGIGTSVFDALVNSSFIKNIKDAIIGPNASLYSTYNVGRQFVTNKSWVRLLSPNKKKLGGGSRVKKIQIEDEWESMTSASSGVTNANYGQQYEYALTDGTSSGVASYEPQLGGDENPFRQPVTYSIDKTWVPNDEFYQEEPFGESFFPTPSVGYSRVTVKNIERENVTRHATGKVVHEFYTAKDFPTITKRSGINQVRAKDDPWSLRSLLKINVRDYMTAAQGFVIELNDMHGKPKSQAVYQENQSTPISTVQYNYKSENYLDGFKLKNKCTTIEKNGNIAVKTIGEFFDMVADFREEKTNTINFTLGVNIDGMLFGVYPAVVPSVWPSFAKQKTRFRSATTTKVIQRFGILDETIATDLGSTVATKNLAYDSETGDVLLTETTTNFNDKVYSFKYPAWWYYESMGPAYQNIGFEMSNVLFVNGIATIGSSTKYFREGDELAIPSNSSGNKKGWVVSVTNTTIEVVDRYGLPANGYSDVKVIRSGKRNTMTTDMATITTLTNPVTSLKSNVYQNVLQAGSVEFTNKRQTHCDCITSSGSPLPFTTNPYVLGTKGNWRPLKSYTHLTGRSQSNYNTNTNIRKDGVFTSYTPFYKWVAGTWQKDFKDWTYVSEVTEFNIYGEELENKDALGRYSSATFGYNQAMALSVAANTAYKEQGFDGFEDYAYNPCMDDHFKFKNQVPNNTESHTGRNSLKVLNGYPVIMNKQIAENCEPVSECNIVITLTTGDSYTLSLSNATEPVSLSWDIISGTPTLTPITGGLQIGGCGYTIEFTVTDSKGCTATKTVSRVCI